MVKTAMLRRNVLLVIGLGLMAAGCHTDLWVQPKLRPQVASTFFPNESISRDTVPHTVARGHLTTDDAFYTGRSGGKLITEIPAAKAMAILELKSYQELLERGQERFDIYCTPCHGQLGDGNGMVAKRGLALKRQPGNYHTDRLRKMPVGHFFEVITKGYGVMYSYAARVEPADRWAIVAYIRALQRSQDAKLSDVPADQVKDMDAEPTEEGSGSQSK